MASRQAGGPNSRNRTFSNERIELQLDRSFFVQEFISAWSKGSVKAPIILGYTTDGNVGDDGFFGILAKHGVNFYDTETTEPVSDG